MLAQRVPPTLRSVARPRRLAVVAVLAVVATVLVVATSQADAVTKTYAPLTGAVVNPERGWYDRVETILDQRDFSASRRDGITLLHSYVRLDEDRDRPIPAATLERLDEGLAAVRASHLKIILRFAYNQGPYPDSAPDATTERILAHIAQLGPVLRRNADVVAAVEAGFIGAWGEWHTSTHGLDQDRAAQRRILAAERAAFPGQLLLRYPADLRALGVTSRDRTVGGSTLAGSVGNHQDCFLAGSPDDNGTFGRDGASAAADKRLVARVGRYAIVGGETCNPDPPARTSCPTALRELDQMHFTYLNRDYEPTSLARLAACRVEIGNRLGYRLQLDRAGLPKRLERGARELSLSLRVRNVGFASPYAARPVLAVVRCGSRTQTVRLGTDVRTWDPGATISVSQKIRLAAPVTGRSCRIGIALPDASASLAGDPAYAIRFASSTSWSSGVNWLGSRPVGD